jgi:hypothetical protein
MSQIESAIDIFFRLLLGRLTLPFLSEIENEKIFSSRIATRRKSISRDLLKKQLSLFSWEKSTDCRYIHLAILFFFISFCLVLMLLSDTKPYQELIIILFRFVLFIRHRAPTSHNSFN